MDLTQAHFAQMVDDHGPVLYRMAYRMVGDRHEAEDLVQETFRSAWKSRARYRRGESDRAWLAAILRRRSVDRWRRKPPPPAISDQRLGERRVHDPEPGRDELSDDLQEALQQLPRQLRETLLLVVVGELTHQEVADLLEIPLGTVLSRVSRARGRLRSLLLAMAETT